MAVTDVLLLFSLFGEDLREKFKIRSLVLRDNSATKENLALCCLRQLKATQTGNVNRVDDMGLLITTLKVLEACCK